MQKNALPRGPQMPKAWNLGGRKSLIPQTRHLFLAFGRGNEGAGDKPYYTLWVQNLLKTEKKQPKTFEICSKEKGK